jgi:hypothetical protein
MSCCSNPTDLGCFDSCQTVTISALTGYVANDIYISYAFNGAFRKQLVTEVTNTGQPIIDLSTFNEDYFYTFELINRISGVSLGCYKIKIFPCAGQLIDIESCVSSDCPNGREISYLSVIEEINCRVDGVNFYVDLTSATFIDLESQIAPTAAYSVQWGDGSPLEAFGFVTELSHDVSSLADGVYYGFVYEAYSTAYSMFWYEVASGVVVDYQKNRTVEIAVALTCDLYPDYTNDVDDTAEITSGYIINKSDISIYGIEVNAETYGGAVILYNETGQLLSSLQNVGSQVISRYQLSTGVFINNFSILRTRCIS